MSFTKRKNSHDTVENVGVQSETMLEYSQKQCWSTVRNNINISTKPLVKSVELKF